MTFDVDLDLEHILDAGPSGDHHVQVWSRFSHLSGRRSDLRKCLQTDRQADRQTDRRRTSHDCISSWNELKTNFKMSASAFLNLLTASHMLFQTVAINL